MNKNSKMKYPISEEDLICIPFRLENGKYKTREIKPDLSYGEITGLAEHHTFESCWICCRAHNIRVGYSDKKVLKLFKLIDNGQEEKSKKGSGKSKKAKTGKTIKEIKGSKKGKKEKTKKGKDSKKTAKPKKSKKK